MLCLKSRSNYCDSQGIIHGDIVNDATINFCQCHALAHGFNNFGHLISCDISCHINEHPLGLSHLMIIQQLMRR